MSIPWINNMLDATTMIVYVNEDMEIVKSATERYGESCYWQGRADEKKEDTEEHIKYLETETQIVETKSMIITDVIDSILKAIREKENEPQYLHDGEDWINGLIIAEEIVEQIKEQKND